MTRSSVQLYSVRDAFGADPAAALARLRDLGFEIVEPYGLAENAALLEPALAAAGLAAPSSHASLVRPGALEPALEAAARLGVETVVEPSVHEGWDSDAGVGGIADALNAAAERAATAGIRVGYHNHWWEFEPVGADGRLALELLAERLAPGVVLELDVYWAAVAGVDVPALVARLGERVGLLHVKDGPVERDPSTQLPAGEGRAPLAAVLAALPDAVRVLEFDQYAGDVFDGLAASLARLPELEPAR